MNQQIKIQLYSLNFLGWPSVFIYGSRFQTPCAKGPKVQLQIKSTKWVQKLDVAATIWLCMYGQSASKQMYSINRSINQMGNQATTSTIWNMVTWLSLFSVQAIGKVTRSPRVFGILSRVFNNAKKNPLSMRSREDRALKRQEINPKRSWKINSQLCIVDHEWQ